MDENMTGEKGRENSPETYNNVQQSDENDTMVTFSVMLPKSQRDALDAYLKRESGLKRGSFVRQLITEFMRRERIW